MSARGSILVVASGYLLLRIRKPIVRRWSAWRRRREASQANLFKRAIGSLATGHWGVALRDLMQWLDRINESDHRARLDVFLRQHGDQRTREIVGYGMRDLELDARISDPSTLIKGLSAARDRWRDDRSSKKRVRNTLPEMNGRSAPEYHKVRGE